MRWGVVKAQHLVRGNVYCDSVNWTDLQDEPEEFQCSGGEIEQTKKEMNK